MRTYIKHPVLSTEQALGKKSVPQANTGKRGISLHMVAFSCSLQIPPKYGWKGSMTLISLGSFAQLPTTCTLINTTFSRWAEQFIRKMWGCLYTPGWRPLLKQPHPTFPS